MIVSKPQIEALRTGVLAGLDAECRRLLRGELLEALPGLVSGKLFRSDIALCIAGKSSPKLIERCTALELLHASTLVHDDIVDEALTRRDHPTTWLMIGRHHALLLGDLLAARAIEIASSKPRLGRSFAEAYTEVNAAQLHELNDRGDVGRTVDRYLDACHGKTAAMLVLAAQIGLASSKVPRRNHGAAEMAVRNVGLAFQICDDIEDLATALASRDAATLGRSKSAVADIVLGNYTLPVLELLAVDDTAAAKLAQATPEERLDIADNEAWTAAMSRASAAAKQHLDAAKHLVKPSAHHCPRTAETYARIHAWTEAVESALLTSSVNNAAAHSLA